MKSRNAASRTQDRKTYELKLSVKPEKNDDLLDNKIASSIYKTTASSSNNKPERANLNIQQKSVNKTAINVHPTDSLSSINKVPHKTTDPQKKLKVSLIGAETHHSRNMMPAKTSVKEKVLQLPVKKSNVQTSHQYYGSKRAYVSSLLQPSASLKK